MGEYVRKNFSFIQSDYWFHRLKLIVRLFETLVSIAWHWSFNCLALQFLLLDTLVSMALKL